ERLEDPLRIELVERLVRYRLYELAEHARALAIGPFGAGIVQQREPRRARVRITADQRRERGARERVAEARGVGQQLADRDRRLRGPLRERLVLRVERHEDFGVLEAGQVLGN